MDELLRGITNLSGEEAFVLVIGICCCCIFFTTIVFKLIEDADKLNRIFPRKENE